MSNVLLREYIKTILQEEDFGGIGGFGEMGLDFTGGDPKKLYNIFVQPFTDVFKTAAGKSKELSQKLQTAGKVAFTTVVTSLIPIFSDKYDEIFANEKEQINKIKSDYKDVYDRAWEAVKDNDILSAAFMYNPAALVTSKVVKDSPKHVASLLNILTGGRLDGLLKKGANPALQRMFANESLLREELNLSPKIKDLINNNPKVQNMQASMRKVIRSSLEQMFDQANSIAKVKTVDDLQKLLGKNVSKLNDIKKLNEPERSQVVQKIVQATKESTKSFYIKKLESIVKKASEAGVPGDHPYVKDHRAALAKIKGI